VFDNEQDAYDAVMAGRVYYDISYLYGKRALTFCGLVDKGW
jgi:hypothetical protein